MESDEQANYAYSLKFEKTDVIFQLDSWPLYFNNSGGKSLMEII